MQVLSGDNPGQKFNPFKICLDLYKQEGGIKGFYNGVEAAFMRTIIYLGARLVLSNRLNDWIK